MKQKYIIDNLLAPVYCAYLRYGERLKKPIACRSINYHNNSKVILRNVCSISNVIESFIFLP